MFSIVKNYFKEPVFSLIRLLITILNALQITVGIRCILTNSIFFLCQRRVDIIPIFPLIIVDNNITLSIVAFLNQPTEDTGFIIRVRKVIDATVRASSIDSGNIIFRY